MELQFLELASTLVLHGVLTVSLALDISRLRSHLSPHSKTRQEPSLSTGLDPDLCATAAVTLAHQRVPPTSQQTTAFIRLSSCAGGELSETQLSGEPVSIVPRVQPLLKPCTVHGLGAIKL